MGRWRPPSQKGSTYITAAGFKRMKEEVTQLWKIERHKLHKWYMKPLKMACKKFLGCFLTISVYINDSMLHSSCKSAISRRRLLFDRLHSFVHIH